MRYLKSTCFALAFGPAVLAVPAGAAEPAIARSADDKALEWAQCPEFMPDGCGIAVLHGNPGEPHTDIFFRVPGGAKIAGIGKLPLPERMVLVSGEMSVTYDWQEPVVLNAGTYAYGPAQKPHSATCRSVEPCTLFIAFVDPIDAIQGAPD